MVLREILNTLGLICLGFFSFLEEEKYTQPLLQCRAEGFIAVKIHHDHGNSYKKKTFCMRLWTLRTLVRPTGSRAEELATRLFQAMCLLCLSLPPFPHLEPCCSQPQSRPSRQFSSLQVHASLGQTSNFPPTTASQDKTPPSKNLSRPLVGPHPSSSPRMGDTDPTAFRPWSPKDRYVIKPAFST